MTSKPGKSASKHVHIIVGRPQFLTEAWRLIEILSGNLSGGLFTAWLSPEQEMKDRDGEKSRERTQDGSHSHS